ncbi:MAG TPA: glucans biosynthesis glucosyltransferase MdoH [Pseudolabrys sp.]|nr:glucans biosynthesis glucosyltransferase MdoH [Pseudolabrys sp.]
MSGRRKLFAALVLGTMAALLWLMALALSPGGLDVLDILILIAFAFTLPWMVIGLWNAIIGLLVMRFAADPVAAVCPPARAARSDAPLTTSTAILACIRNEPPDRIVRNLEPMLQGLTQAGAGAHCHVYVLSDTNDARVATLEETRFGTLASTWADRIAITYRRRTDNAGFKAGNIRDFCTRWGAQHDFAVTLDTDSMMPAEAILRLIRVMQADPTLGILQGLVIGLPSTSAFARLFQFGMRLGMRSYTLGSTWWQGDCGPYWGHNAILRLRPFIEDCELPQRKGGDILSHDQVEAVLMRRAGYAVRVLPEEDLGWEENPTTLVEFIRRDLRWCQGNLQYWSLLNIPGLKLVSRYQLLFAILMFLGSPAWIALLLLGSAKVALAASPGAAIRPDAGFVLLALVLVMWFSPQLATAIDVLTRRGGAKPFGGVLRFIVSFLAQVIFFTLLSPIMWFSHTLLVLSLPFNRKIGWIGQLRDDHSVRLALAARSFWPHTVAGLAILGLLALTQASAIPVALLIAGGLTLSVPLAMVSSWPRLGEACVRLGLGRLPEETDPPGVLRAVGVPAIELMRAPPWAGPFRVLERLRTARGVIRSLRTYYGDKPRRAAMAQLYGQFIKPGDLVFDVGAHVGDRIAAFRSLGARVVAVEPQPALLRVLSVLYGRDRKVAIEGVAVGRTSGTTDLILNIDNPTVATASQAFVAAADGAAGWEGQSWSKRLAVLQTTLDALIARHGMPRFIKIDVEGFEAETLAGLTQPVPALSFEFTTIQRDVALACLERCGALGFARFNTALGESQQFAHADWIDATAMAQWITALPHAANSGDVYAIRA